MGWERQGAPASGGGRAGSRAGRALTLGTGILALLLAMAPGRAAAGGGTSPGCAGADADGDGFSCEVDCDDTRFGVFPGALEDPANGIDDDCDGRVDEPDGDGDGSTEAAGDCNDGDPSVHPGAAEAQPGVDDDCDGLLDEAAPVDADGDGVSAAAGDCDDGDPSIGPSQDEAPDGEDQDCDDAVDEGTVSADDDGDGFCEGVEVSGAAGALWLCFDGAAAGDCNDADPAIHPGATDLPDGVDDDCDGLIDGGGAATADEDGDGVGAEVGDCDDGDPDVAPGAPETADGVDEDCDGVTDEGTVAADDDGDGQSELDGDCDDRDADVHPGAQEALSGVDEDCDGAVDEDSPAADDDGDGLSEEAGDCDDAAAQVAPDAPELAGNGIDDDCDGAADEATTFDDDLDVDGDGVSIADGDCDDLDPEVRPGVEEVCDGVDTDCDGAGDEASCDDALAADTTGCASAPGGAGPLGLLVLAALALGRRRGAAVMAVAVSLLGACEGDGSGEQGVGRLGVSPDGLLVDLGPINVGETAAASLYLFNAGGGPLTIASARIDGTGGPFLLGSSYAGTLAVGEEVEIPITYQPTEAGTQVARVLVNHQVGGADEVGVTTVTLRGRASLLDVAAVPELVDFGPVAVGAPTTRTVSLLNRGLAPVSLTGAQVSGPGFGWRLTRQGQTLPLTVGPGASVSVEVEADPADLEPAEGTLSVTFAGLTVEAALRVNRCPGSTVAAWDGDGDGVTSCAGDCDDADEGVGPAAWERADGVDEDCDGIVDEGTAAWDDDGDCACEAQTCVGSTGSCDPVTGGDCNDADGAIHPGAPEFGKDPDALQNGVDDDCDGAVDDSFGADFDGDGITGAAGDCDDDDATAHPGGAELADGADQDCDGAADEGTAAADDDGDGFCEGIGSPAACTDGAQPGDCDDRSPDRSPTDAEGEDAAGLPPGEDVHAQADGLDNDCDGEVDEAQPPADADGDGYAPEGGDCDDADADVFPGAAEACDGVDDNCDGVLGAGESDGDGDGLAGCAGDCDDDDAAIHPGAAEACNGLDDDCDGQADPPGDADSDGLPNGQESPGDLDGDGVEGCFDADADGDFVPDGQEGPEGADPADPDTDDDGYIDLVEIVLDTDPADPASNPDVGEDLVFVAPAGEALEPGGSHPLAFDTYIQLLDLYWSFDYTTSMRTELIVMKSVEKGVQAIMAEMTCAVSQQCVGGGTSCPEGSPTESVPCVENPDCADDEVCGLAGVCIEDPLLPGSVPDIWTGVGVWDALNSFENALGLQADPAATAAAIPTVGSGVYESPSQASACAASGANCTNVNTLRCATTGRGCPGFRADSLAIYLQVTDANEQCAGSTTQCSYFTPEFGGQELARQGIRFIGLYGDDDPSNYEGYGTPQSIAERIGIASGTVDGQGRPYVVEAVDEAVATNTVTAVRSLLSTFPLTVTIEAEDAAGDDGDALRFIQRLVTAPTGQGACTATVGGQPLAVLDTDSDGYPDAYDAVLAGTSVCWDLQTRPTNDVVPATAAPQVYHAVLRVFGEGAALGLKDVFFIVPPAL